MVRWMSVHILPTKVAFAGLFHSFIRYILYFIASAVVIIVQENNTQSPMCYQFLSSMTGAALNGTSTTPTGAASVLATGAFGVLGAFVPVIRML